MLAKCFYTSWTRPKTAFCRKWTRKNWQWTTCWTASQALVVVYRHRACLVTTVIDQSGGISWRLDFVPWDEDVYFRWCCNSRCTWQTYGKINLHGISWKIQPARFDDFWTCRCYRQHQAGTDGHRELIFKCFAAETRHHTTRSLAAVQGQWELPLGMNVVNSELVEVRKRKRRVVL